MNIYEKYKTKYRKYQKYTEYQNKNNNKIANLENTMRRHLIVNDSYSSINNGMRSCPIKNINKEK